MPIPDDDVLCRFVRERDWSYAENRPRPGAFKQPNLSVWHLRRLDEQGVSPAELQIAHLAGSGQAHHTAGDYTRLARQVAQFQGLPFQVQVEWRPEDESVAQPWRQWNYAHIQVEAIEGPSDFLRDFRNELARRCRHQVPPNPP